MRVYIIDKSRSVLTHFEEIRLFVRLFDLAAAVGTFAADKLTFCPERFARRAVPPLVGTLIYVALLIEFVEYLANLFFVILVRRSDKLIVVHVYAFPDGFYLVRNGVDVFFRRFPERLCLLLYFLTVFVRSGLEKDVVALLLFKSRDTVRKYRLVSIADMRLGGSIGYRRRDIIFFFHSDYII